MESTLFSLFWKGFEPCGHEFVAPKEMVLHLQPRADHVPLCSRCGRPTPLVHDTAHRCVREVDLMGYRLWLDVPVRRLRCPTCGVATEAVSWLPPRSRLTTTLREQAEMLLRLMPIKHVAEVLGLHWHTLRRIDHERLRREVPPPAFSRVRRLIIDEFALYKGHRYATVVICADTQRVLWVGTGRSRSDLRPFFELLGPSCRQIEAVAMDMNAAFDQEVRAHCPGAEVVYDLFHVVAKYGREVIDRVRLDQVRALRREQPQRKVVKSSRWLLLRSRKNLTEAQDEALRELLSANRPLAIVYLLKEELKALWYAPSAAEARQRWQQWYHMALYSGVEPLAAFARRLAPYANGIAASALYRLSTSVLEGMNNKIKVLKRMAYGYRDEEYFFLKIRDAFPGKVR